MASVVNLFAVARSIVASRMANFSKSLAIDHRPISSSVRRHPSQVPSAATVQTPMHGDGMGIQKPGLKTTKAKTTLQAAFVLVLVLVLVLSASGTRTRPTRREYD
jgi:hypothetical protein